MLILFLGVTHKRTHVQGAISQQHNPLYHKQISASRFPVTLID
jgi:hypothetical protein